MISWITENVVIGEYTDAVNEKLLKKEKIDCVLSLRGSGVEDSSNDERYLLYSLGISFFRVPVLETTFMSDIKIMLRVAAYMLKQLTKKYKKILVHCTAGIDRAPFVVAYWMAKKKYKDGYEGLRDLDDYRDDCQFWVREHYRIIKKKRPQIMRHLEWI